MWQAFPWLLLLLFLPILGAGACFLVPEGARTHIRGIAVGTSGAAFVLSIALAWVFDSDAQGLQFSTSLTHLISPYLNYRVGLDGISLAFVLLTTFLMLIAVIISWEQDAGHVRRYFSLLLLLEFFTLGVFCVQDLLLFLIFFEGTLIPTFFLILGFGSENRRYAALKFLTYTMAGSIFMILASLYVMQGAGTSAMSDLTYTVLSSGEQLWVWIGFMLAIAVKMPIWPLHTWLPDAHGQAPTAGSMILAGLLLKIAGYAAMRLVFPLCGEATAFFAPMMQALGVMAILYAALMALAQKDAKQLVAYSSVSHMGFVTLGLFSLSVGGVQGALFQMISHGLISAGIFACVGRIYARLHSRNLADMGGLARDMPFCALCLMVLTLGNIGLPGTSGFIGEFLVLCNLFPGSPLMTALAALGVVGSAAYGLWLYRAVMWGERAKIKEASPVQVEDFKLYEKVAVGSLVIGVLALGLFPGRVLDLLKSASTQSQEDVCLAFSPGGTGRNEISLQSDQNDQSNKNTDQNHQNAVREGDEKDISEEDGGAPAESEFSV